MTMTIINNNESRFDDIKRDLYTIAHKILVVCMVLKDPAHQALGDDVSIVSTCELIQLYILIPAFS